MKAALPLLLAIALLAAPRALPSQATPPAPPRSDPFVKNQADPATTKSAPWQSCTLIFEVYALAPEEAFALLDAERDGAARYRRVTELAKSSKARLEILTSITTKSGARAVTESTDVLRYPSAFAPPPQYGTIAPPLAYESRNVGDCFEVEPVISPDATSCLINLIPSRTRFAGFHDLGAMLGDSPVAQPLFQSQRITTATKATPDVPQFLGTMNPPKTAAEPSEIRLAFLHAKLPAPKVEQVARARHTREIANVALEYSLYSTARAEARELLLASSDLLAPAERLAALLASKRARLEHRVSLKTQSGSRAVVEEALELPVAEGYSPASLHTSTDTENRTSTTRPGEPSPERGQNARIDASRSSTTTESATITRIAPGSEPIPGTPRDLGVHQTGCTIEVEPVVSDDGAVIELNHILSATEARGPLQVAGVASLYPSQPIFETRKLTTSQKILAGHDILIGTFNPPGDNGVNDRRDDGRAWLAFVRVTPE